MVGSYLWRFSSCVFVRVSTSMSRSCWSGCGDAWMAGWIHSPFLYLSFISSSFSYYNSDVLGACLCRPPDVGYEAWMPLLLFVVESEEGDLVVCVSAVTDQDASIGLTEVMTDALIEQAPYADMNYEPPSLAMGTWPEVLCCSLGSTIVIIVRRKGLVVAYELADTGLELIAQEHVGHYVVDAVMRYSAVEGGAEIVLLMSDSENTRDGRVGTFCFRTAG